MLTLCILVCSDVYNKCFTLYTVYEKEAWEYLQCPIHTNTVTIHSKEENVYVREFLESRLPGLYKPDPTETDSITLGKQFINGVKVCGHYTQF